MENSMSVKNIMLTSALVSLSALSFAEPNVYGNMNFNFNIQENYNLAKDQYFIDSTESYLGFRDKFRATDVNGFITDTKYQVQLGLDLQQDSPVYLEEAFIGMGTKMGDILVGHQQDIVYDILTKPMDIFYGTDIIAATASEFVSTKSKNTIRLNSQVGTFYVGASFTMDDNDPDSDLIDSQAWGFAKKGRNYQYGAAYWTDKNWNDEQSVSYWGSNVSYNGQMWGTSVSYVYTDKSDVPETLDGTLTVRFSQNVFLKTRYSNLSDQWNAYAAGFNVKVNNKSNYYAEYQNRHFENEAIESQSVITLGLNTKF